MKSLIKSFYLALRRLLLKSAEPFLSQRNKRSDFQNVTPDRILFIRIDRIGDMVLSTPALQALKTRYPNSHLSILASKSNKSILLRNPYVDEILFQNSDSVWKLPAFLKWLVLLRKTHYNIVIDPMSGHDLKTAIIAYFVRADLRIGYSGYGREVFFSRRPGEVDNGKHFVDLTLDLVREIGCTNNSIPPKVYLDPHEMDWAASWLQQHNHSTRPPLGIHPGGYYETQRWPTKYYATLLKMLSSANHKIVLFGGPADKKLVCKIANLSDESPLIFVSPDLRKTMALMSKLKLIICNNSGPLHIASALNLPTVSFIGPTNKVRWAPIGKKHTVLQVDGLECLGCEQGTCPKGSIDCMWRISPEKAFRAINEMLYSDKNGLKSPKSSSGPKKHNYYPIQ